MLKVLVMGFLLTMLSKMCFLEALMGLSIFFFFLFFLSMAESNLILLTEFFMWDTLSFLLIMLSVWITILMLMAMVSTDTKDNYYFYFYCLMLMMMLYISFSVFNLLVFYLFFESSLIPIVMMIYKWGNQPERISAGVYMLMYTLFGSLPLLVIFLFYFTKVSMSWYFLFYLQVESNFLLQLVLVFAFLVKMPMYSVHLWLPKAHVEAPVAGSMMLAGVLLKLGGYGIVRVMTMMMVEIFNSFSMFIMSISLVGALYVSMICLCQIDMKSLIAYSSVCHMSLVIGGLFSQSIWGMRGALVLMLAHGLCSSGLFCLANMSYERFFTRSMFMLKGMMLFSPSITLLWFLMSVFNMGAPPSMNLLGEVMLLGSIFSWNFNSVFIIMMLSFLGACYSLYLYSSTQHGKSWFLYGVLSYSKREYLLGMAHLLPLLIYILKGNFIFI